MLLQLQTQLVFCMCVPDAECAPGCPEKWIGDTVCDESCRYSAACQYDAGDCDSVATPAAPTSAGLFPSEPMTIPAVLVHMEDFNFLPSRRNNVIDYMAFILGS